MTLQRFRVYVIEIDRAAVKKAAVKGVVYVGETALSPEQRFEKHQLGGKTSVKKVRDHGVALHPDLAPRSAFMSRASVLRAEKRTADRLRRRGYTVLGGQGEELMKGLNVSPKT